MKKALFNILLASLLVLISSCKVKEDIDYMKNIEETAIQTSIQNSTFTIQPGDQLMILVSAKDNNVVKPFNQNYTSSDVSQYSLPSSNLPIQSQSSISGPTYLVDSKGVVTFPIIGELLTEGKTIEVLRDELTTKLKKYIINPTVNIQNTNFKITVLGEVNKTGTFVVPDGQSMTLLSVLGMAGDLTIYGERKNVLIIRNTNGETSKAYVDLTDAELLNSPYYYIKQNDVVVVSPNKTRKNSSSFGPQTNVIISIASVAVGLLALIFR